MHSIYMCPEGRLMLCSLKKIIVLGFSPKEYDLDSYGFMAHLIVQSMGSILWSKS